MHPDPAHAPNLGDLRDLVRFSESSADAFDFTRVPVETRWHDFVSLRTCEPDCDDNPLSPCSVVGMSVNRHSPASGRGDLIGSGWRRQNKRPGVNERAEAVGEAVCLELGRRKELGPRETGSALLASRFQGLEG